MTAATIRAHRYLVLGFVAIGACAHTVAGTTDPTPAPCLLTTQYFGLEVGDTLPLTPGMQLGAWITTITEATSLGETPVDNIETKVLYRGRTGERAYSFVVDRQELRMGMDGWQVSPEEPLSIYYSSDTTIVTVGNLLVNLIQSASDPRAVMRYHPAQGVTPCPQ